MRVGQRTVLPSFSRDATMSSRWASGSSACLRCARPSRPATGRIATGRTVPATALRAPRATWPASRDNVESGREHRKVIGPMSALISEPGAANCPCEPDAREHSVPSCIFHFTCTHIHNNGGHFSELAYPWPEKARFPTNSDSWSSIRPRWIFWRRRDFNLR